LNFCRLRNSFLFALLMLLLTSNLYSQSLVRLLMPDCADPFSTVNLQVEIQLEEGATLRSYGIRIHFDSTRVTLRDDQIVQGNWLQSAGGSVLFFRNIYPDDLFENSALLIVDSAIMGPGLHVTGGGMVFEIPVEIAEPGLVDLEITSHTMYDVDGVPFFNIAVPAALQAPCIDFNLQIDYLPNSQEVQLNWLPQDWTDSYVIQASADAYFGWNAIGTTNTTSWTDPNSTTQRYYRLKAVFSSTP
jgi:hypothetical protein